MDVNKNEKSPYDYRRSEKFERYERFDGKNSDRSRSDCLNRKFRGSNHFSQRRSEESQRFDTYRRSDAYNDKRSHYASRNGGSDERDDISQRRSERSERSESHRRSDTHNSNCQFLNRSGSSLRNGGSHERDDISHRRFERSERPESYKRSDTYSSNRNGFASLNQRTHGYDDRSQRRSEKSVRSERSESYRRSDAYNSNSSHYDSRNRESHGRDDRGPSNSCHSGHYLDQFRPVGSYETDGQKNESNVQPSGTTPRSLNTNVIDHSGRYGNSKENVDYLNKLFEMRAKETTTMSASNEQLSEKVSQKRNEWENKEKDIKTIVDSSLVSCKAATGLKHDDSVVACQKIEAIKKRRLTIVCFATKGPANKNYEQKPAPKKLEEANETRQHYCRISEPRDDSIVKNNNPEWHSLNVHTYCKICDVFIPSRSSVNHYVNVHPEREVFCSRVAPGVANVLRNTTEVHQCKSASNAFNRSTYKQLCYFCDESKCFNKDGWIKHLITHTGPSRYQCTICFKSFATSADQLCVNGTDKCKFKRLLQFRGDKLIAFLCDLCNYVRLDENEMETHLLREHDEEVREKFSEVIFLRFPEVRKYFVSAQQDEMARASTAIEKASEKQLSSTKIVVNIELDQDEFTN